MNANAPHSDALVFFGATGDLAYKKIFPALQSMARRGHLDVPVIAVARSGWTLTAAIDEGVPSPVLSAALYQRFSSRGEADFENKVLSAMRFGFGGHLEKSKDGDSR